MQKAKEDAKAIQGPPSNKAVGFPERVCTTTLDDKSGETKEVGAKNPKEDDSQ